MSPELSGVSSLPVCFPRVSGDEPVARSTMRPEMLFSPRERG